MAWRWPAGIPTMSTLISHEELAGRLEEVRLCDIRWDLIDPSRSRDIYESGHIPGAVFVDLDHDLAAPPDIDGRHPLPDVSTFASTLGRLGITPDSDVVVYDDVAGRYAARMWWMLWSIGHHRVRLLDGGYQTWLGDIETGPFTPAPASYPVPDRFRGVATRGELSGRVLIDARAGERYRGEVEPVDPKAGHIPGAINISTSRNLRSDGRFLDAADLAGVYSAMPPDAIVSCGSGVTACHDALAMVIAGHAMPDVYIGSFSEWSRHDLPVAVGPDP